MNAQIELIENDIRRATAQANKYRSILHADRSEENHWTWCCYQNIVDKLEIKLEDLRG
jgi:hypothetical protein